MAEICKTARLRKKIVVKSSHPKWLLGGSPGLRVSRAKVRIVQFGTPSRVHERLGTGVRVIQDAEGKVASASIGGDCLFGKNVAGLDVTGWRARTWL